MATLVVVVMMWKWIFGPESTGRDDFSDFSRTQGDLLGFVD